MARDNFGFGELSGVLTTLEQGGLEPPFVTPASYAVIVGAEVELNGGYTFKTVRKLVSGLHAGASVEAAKIRANVGAETREDQGCYAFQEGIGVVACGFDPYDLSVAQAVLTCVMRGGELV